MCGIIGGAIKAQNGFFQGEIKVVEELLYIDALRGPDSTGLACFFNDGSMRLTKAVEEAAFFRYNKEYEDVFKCLLKNGKAVIGHNRKKTTGKIDEDSAHPFTIADENGAPRYLFVHNGTLTNTYSLEKNLPLEVKLKSDVDSEILGNLICTTNGDKTALETALGSVYGAYACVWIDQKEEKLYMLRNKERPLFVAETSVGLFWASEPGFLYAACNRNRVKVDKCEQIDEDCLYSIDLSAFSQTLVKEPLTIKKATPVTHKVTGNNIGRRTGATNPHSFRADGKVSKNVYKRFVAKWTGAIASFYIDDYVEMILGTKDNDKWWVWGENPDDFDIPHQCRGIVRNIDEHALIMNYAGAMVWGRISAITRDETTGGPVLMLNHISVSKNGVVLKERENEKLH